jgi:hypothetical protein
VHTRVVFASAGWIVWPNVPIPDVVYPASTSTVGDPEPSHWYASAYPPMSARPASSDEDAVAPVVAAPVHDARTIMVSAATHVRTTGC